MTYSHDLPAAVSWDTTTSQCTRQWTWPMPPRAGPAASWPAAGATPARPAFWPRQACGAAGPEHSAWKTLTGSANCSESRIKFLFRLSLSLVNFFQFTFIAGVSLRADLFHQLPAAKPSRRRRKNHQTSHPGARPYQSARQLWARPYQSASGRALINQ